jgi:hypothetical protein
VFSENASQLKRGCGSFKEERIPVALRVDENVQKGIPVSGSLYWATPFFIYHVKIYGVVYMV